MNYVSYSLFGDDPKYLVGAVQNALDVPQKYPAFKAVFFVDDATVPRRVIGDLINAGAKVRHGNSRWMKNGKLWRLLATMFDDATIVLFRDVDSRITSREVAAVKEWLVSPYSAHVMRDFPKHTAPIMAGMWGIKNYLFSKRFITKLWDTYVATVPDWDQASDQVFLKRAIWPVIKDNAMQHDEFTGASGTRQFPVPFDPVEGFVGEIFLADGNKIPEHSAFRGVAPYGPK
jgi:hypothetical protein